MLLAGLGLSDGPLQGTDRLIVDLALALLLTSAAESVVSFWASFAVLRWFDFAPDLALAGAAVLGVLSALNTLYAVMLLKLVSAGCMSTSTATGCRASRSRSTPSAAR